MVYRQNLKNFIFLILVLANILNSRANLQFPIDHRPELSIVSPDTSPPKLFPSGLRGVDIPKSSTLRLRCECHEKIYWSYSGYTGLGLDLMQKLSGIESNCVKKHDGRKLCESIAEFENVSYEHTGAYTCHHGSPENIHTSNSIYIFVNDDQCLLIPYDGVPLIFWTVLQNESTTIPCVPTHSKANVTLWRTNAIKDRQIKPNETVTYDPTQGFHFKAPIWDAESISLECVAEMNGKNQSIPVNINWIIKPSYDLNPRISSRNADYVVVNQTFILNCTVDLDLGVLAQVSWTYPSRNVSGNIVEGESRDHKSSHFKTVFRNLTVHNAQLEDGGNYTCSVADASERVYTSSIMVKIYDKPAPSSINFSTALDLRHYRVKTGENLTLVVNVRAFPDLDSVYMFWMKDDRRIGNARGKKDDGFNNPSRRRQFRRYKMSMAKNMVDQAILTATNVTMMDSGIFTLIGNSTDTTARISLFVKVTGKPHIDLSAPEKLYFTQNLVYNITCSVIASPEPKTLWQFYPCAPQSCKRSAASGDLEWKDPFEYPLNSEKLIVTPVEVDGYDKDSINGTPIYDLISWRISETLNVKANQSGLYRCAAANSNGIGINDMMFIVTDAGSDGFSVSLNSSEIVEQEDIELICHASLYNYTNLVWYFRPENDSHRHIRLLTNDYNSDESSNMVITNHNQNLSHTLTSTIVLKSIDVNSSGLYICNATVRSDSKEKEVHEIRSIDLKVEKIQAPIILETNMLVNDELLEVQPSKPQEFRCYFTGKPRPHIEWLKNGQPFNITGMSGIDLVDNDQKLIINRLVSSDKGKYECRIHNKGGHQERFTSLKVIGSSGDGMSLANIMAIITFLIVALVLVFVAFAVGRKVREDRKQQIEFFTKNLFNNAQMDLINPERPLDEQVDFLPYDPRWEFPSNRLKLIRTLGEGAFGIVILAEAIGLSDEGGSELVAVKMLKSHSDYNQKKALIAELKILIHLGRHLNIVNCLGAVTKNLERGKLMVMVEYCRYGSLQTFLQNNRDVYVNQLDPETGEISQKHAGGSGDEMDKEEDRNEPALSLVSNPFYTENNVNLQVKGSNQQLNSSNSRISPISFLSKAMSKSVESRINCREDKSDIEVNTRTLIAYSFQVARGMEYLEQKRLIHRDLAARNVLVSDKGVVKICDFGMAKNVQRDDNYVKKGDGPLPIKWMAIESIGDRIFTIKSDVWSFGVLLWEIFTLGANPYPGVEANQQFYEQLRNGYRMSKPELCPNSVYRIMSNCWEADSDRRPNFTQLSNRLGLLIEESVRDYYLELNNPYQEKNKLLQEDENYLQMSSCGDNPAEYEYANMNAIMNPPNEPYDAIGKISSSRVAPMEVVPMIHFDTYNDNDNDKRNEESYLTMNISSQSESSPPPNYDLVIDQQAINKPNYANISSVTYI